MRRLLVLAVLPFLSLLLVAQAPRVADYTSLARQDTLVIPGFQFHTNELLPELRIHYATWGTPKRNAAGEITNAVLLLHGTLGSGLNWGGPYAGQAVHPLLGPGAPFDIAEYYVIAPDTIGSGKSSRPSGGLHMKFPRYNLEDIVKAERLLVEHLGAKHLVAIMGASMGGRQTWQWGIQYPGFADALIPMISSPFPNAGQRAIIDYLPAQIIESDPAWKNGEYEKNPEGARLADLVYSIFLSTQERYLERFPTREEAAAYVKTGKGAFQFPDANDFLYMMYLNDGFDAASHLDRITCPVLIINMAGDNMVPVELGQSKLAAARLKNATYLEIPEERKYGHGALGRTTGLWAPRLREWLHHLPRSSN